MLFLSYVAGGLEPWGLFIDELAVAGGVDELPATALFAAFVFGDCELFNCSFFTTGSRNIKY